MFFFFPVLVCSPFFSFSLPLSLFLSLKTGHSWKNNLDAFFCAVSTLKHANKLRTILIYWIYWTFSRYYYARRLYKITYLTGALFILITTVTKMQLMFINSKSMTARTGIFLQSHLFYRRTVRMRNMRRPPRALSRQPVKSIWCPLCSSVKIIDVPKTVAFSERHGSRLNKTSDLYTGRCNASRVYIRLHKCRIRHLRVDVCGILSWRNAGKSFGSVFAINSFHVPKLFPKRHLRFLLFSCHGDVA